MDIGADKVDMWERIKKKKNPDTGFAGLIFAIISLCSICNISKYFIKLVGTYFRKMYSNDR